MSEAAKFELGTDGPTVIMTGVDGSRTSMRAAAYAVGLARRQRARLVAVYVDHEPGSSALTAFAPGAAGLAADASHDLGEEIRQRLTDGAKSIGMEVEYVVAHGDPFAELVRVGEEVRAELLVVGASESAGHRFAGSLAVRLIRAGRWPVTVVP